MKVNSKFVLSKPFLKAYMATENVLSFLNVL